MMVFICSSVAIIWAYHTSASCRDDGYEKSGSHSVLHLRPEVQMSLGDKSILA